MRAQMGPFDDRSTRLARRQESEVFARYVMPVSWFFGLVGLLALIAVSFSSDGWLFPVFAAFLAAPFVMLVVRISRGHFHKDIRNKRTKI
jgi:fatty acid desaturase